MSMANNLFSHDSLLEIFQDDSAWQIALGRWAHPFLIFLRGGLTMNMPCFPKDGSVAFVGDTLVVKISE